MLKIINFLLQNPKGFGIRSLAPSLKNLMCLGFCGLMLLEIALPVPEDLLYIETKNTFYSIPLVITPKINDHKILLGKNHCSCLKCITL